MVSLVQYLVSFFLREGLQLQRLVSEKRHGQMKVVIPQLRGEAGFSNINTIIKRFQVCV